MRKAELKELYKMMFPDYPDIVTVAQPRKMMGISRHVAYELLAEKEISAITIGNIYRIPKVSVINYVMTGKIGKSWLMLWLGIRVAQGLPLWELPTH